MHHCFIGIFICLFSSKSKMTVTAFSHLTTRILFRVLSLTIEYAYVWAHNPGFLNQRILYFICVSSWKLEEYHIRLQKTEIDIEWYILMSWVHFKTGQTQVVFGQVRNKNSKTLNPRLFSCNHIGLWCWKNPTFKKLMIRCTE